VPPTCQNKADTSGNERSTTVNSISVMSWRPPLEQYERIPAICLIRKSPRFKASLAGGRHSPRRQGL
jgi:hypothetical protein